MHASPQESKGSESKGNDEETRGLPRSFERFTLLRRIARGGMGEVFLATSGGIEGAERPVVIKIIRKDHDADSSFLARFLDEARIQSQLSHPGVAQILEASTDGAGKPYVVVEHVEGKNLGDVRGRAAQLGVRIEWPEAVALAVTMGDALAHVHERTDAEGRPLDIVHRDLSPQNVMVGYGGDVKLIDFGTARGENRRCHTVSGVVFAKPGYVAPEVANNTPGGVPADLYAFGVMLWEMLAGRRFLVGEPSAHLAAVGAGKKALTPIAQSVGAPLELDMVLARLTAQRIEDRYTSARLATGDLAKLLQRVPTRADGDRSVRGRVAHLMHRLYPAEPARSRSDFQALVAGARSVKGAPPLLPPSPEPPAQDDGLLAGTRYRIERELGRGAMGIVYAATHADLGRPVALKVLDREFAGGAARARFVAEARAVARIEHEGLVKLYEFGFASDGRPFYAMELVEGKPLDRKLAERGAFPWREAVKLAIDTSHAVEAAHLAGLVHRDIKPHNLLVTATGGVKLLDFGIAKRESEIEPNDDEIEALSVIGTPEYMAPEQARGAADARSDVYALGVVLYELLTASLPHQGASTAALIERKLSGLAEPASALAPEALPRELDRVLAKAMMAEPEARFEDMTAFRSALERVLDGRARGQSVRRGIGMALVGAVTFAAVAVVGAKTPLAHSAGIHAALGMAHQAVERARAAVSHAPTGTVAKAPPATVAPLVAATVAEPSPPAAATFGEDTEVAEAAKATGDTDTSAAASADAADEGEKADASDAPEATKTAGAAASSGESASPADPASPAAEVLAHVEELRQKGRDLKALAAIRTAARTYPRDRAVLALYVRAAEESKAYGEAHKVALRWVEVDKSSNARLTLARLERATGNAPKAFAILESVLKSDPESTEAHRLVTLWSRDQRLAVNR
ncbi:MAG TPA: protein kinase [Polyangiaceae bacterium]|nr:protein kinase [Polyangiaceae bacterium]